MRHHTYAAARLRVLIEAADEMIVIAGDDVMLRLSIEKLRREFESARSFHQYASTGAPWPWERAA